MNSAVNHNQILSAHHITIWQTRLTPPVLEPYVLLSPLVVTLYSSGLRAIRIAVTIGETHYSYGLRAIRIAVTIGATLYSSGLRAIRIAVTIGATHYSSGLRAIRIAVTIGRHTLLLRS
jgi:hypothetical protein